MFRRFAAAFTAAVLLLLTLPGTSSAEMGEYRVTVRYQSSGSAAAELQEALAALGYYTYAVDGRAGAKTVTAIRAFQKDHGLKADGVAGPITWNAVLSAFDSLSSDGAVTEETSASDPSAAPAVTDETVSGDSGVLLPADSGGDGAAEDPSAHHVQLTVTVRRGMRGDAVAALQEALIVLGYRPGTADGICGSATVSAIRAFQKDHGLTTDGTAGPKTLSAINASLSGAAEEVSSSTQTSGTVSDAEAAADPSADEAASGAEGEKDTVAVPATALKYGDRGDDVYLLQRVLNLLGYYSLSLDGSYGKGTLAAVKGFQRANGLTADGAAGPKTLDAMRSALDRLLNGPSEAELKEWMDTLARANGVKNGAAVITRNGDTLLEWSWGGTGPDTCFRIASVTKWVTAIGLLTLYDQGRLDLDEDISVYLPFTVRNPGHPDVKITARMLLNHTSSFRPDALDYHPDWDRIGKNGYDPLFMENLEPGTMYTYADFDGALLGSLIEAITGESVQTYMDRTVFGPLGLTAAYTPRLLPEGTDTADLLGTDGTVRISVRTDTERDFFLTADPAGNCGYTVGRLFINASSLTALSHMMLGGGALNGVRVLEEDTVKLMEEDVTPAQSPYGLGQVRYGGLAGGTWYGHQGRYSGLTSNIYYRKEDGLTLALILNGYDYALKDNIVLPAYTILSNTDTLLSPADASVDQ